MTGARRIDFLNQALAVGYAAAYERAESVIGGSESDESVRLLADVLAILRVVRPEAPCGHCEGWGCESCFDRGFLTHEEANARCCVCGSKDVTDTVVLKTGEVRLYCGAIVCQGSASIDSRDAREAEEGVAPV